MQRLADFLNHGILPFMGREEEMRRILDFWRGTFEATELRAMLVTGEAGIGKSRLLEQVVGRIVDAGGSVVHVKLYAESTASFISLVARSLWHGPTERSILGDEPEAKLGPVGSALQRLARLRPTLLVLEDLHLLGAEARPELSRLLKLLADETISVLALARPVELEARGSLEPYITAEFTLKGLPREECARVWEEVSGSTTGPEVAAALHDATAGNPLALRSALRGTLKSGDKVGAWAGKKWASADSATALARTLKRSVGLLADGMTTHLSPEELDGATRLASLGEIFSREAAAAVLDDAEPMIESLLFNGIIATAVAPPDPLYGDASADLPLSFTHTLLHRQLIVSPCFDADRLISVVATSPLYSLLPFRLLSENPWVARSIDTAIVMKAYNRAIKIEIAINRSALWRKADQPWKTGVHLLASRLGSWTHDDWERMLVKLIHHKLNLVRREPKDVREWWLRYLDSVTAEASSDELVKGRFFALYHRALLYSAGDRAMTRALWDEAESLVANRPHLQFTFAYTDYVIAGCVGVYRNNDLEMMRTIESRATELLASEDLPADIRRTFERQIRPPLLSLYNNADELHSRLEQVADFEALVDKGELNVWTFCITLLAETASVDLLTKICDSVLPLMKEQGMMSLVAITITRRECVLAGVNDSISELIQTIEETTTELPQFQLEQNRIALGLNILDAALLRNEIDQAESIMKHYGIRDHDRHSLQSMLLALGASEGVTERLAAIASDEGQEGDELVRFMNMVTDGGNTLEPSTITRRLSEPILRLTDIMKCWAMIGIIEHSCRTTSGVEIPAELRTSLTDLLTRSMEWLAAPGRGLFAFMRPLLIRGETYFTKQQSTAWRKRIEELAYRHNSKQQTARDGKLRLSMLGTISAHDPVGKEQRFQGARARMLLAMMVINQMLREPLSTTEFCRLAAGDDEIGSARDVVKTTVHRIREQLGRDAILTDDQGPPRMNPDLVDVDLLEAHGLLKRATDAVRRSSPMQAKGALMAAMDITRHEVLFPSLYDEIVEAVRQDFENRLRATSIDVARALTREGGVEDAVDVLRRVNDAIPGDEELAELLRDALLQCGRNAEASRVAMTLDTE